MFMDGKTQYYKTQYYKEIINVFKIRHFFFFGNLQAHPKMCMQIEKARIAKTSTKKYRVAGLPLPDKN